MTDLNTDQDTAAIHRLKFADKHVVPILKRKKTATIRVGLDGDIQIGDRLELRDQGGERFASVEVSDRGYTTVDMAARMDIDGHRSYEDADELLDELRTYYPDEELHDQSRVELIYWEEAWE